MLLRSLCAAVPLLFAGSLAPWCSAQQVDEIGPLIAVDEASSEAAAESKTTFWFATYPGAMTELDPESDQVLRKIPFRHGMPWSVDLTHDQKQFLVVTKQQTTVEVVDIDAGKVVDEHVFDEDGYVIRVRNVTEIPGGKKWYVRIDRVKKHLDHFSFEPSQYLLYDVENKKIEKRLKKMPEKLSRGAQISPDGESWHVLGRDGNFVVIDPETLKEVAKIDLKTPRFGGAGAIRMNGPDLLHRRDPKRYRSMYTSQDPIEKKRTTWGVIEIDLEKYEIVSITEWGSSLSSWGMRVSRDGRFGASMSGGGSRGSRLSVFDLSDGRRVSEHYQEFRPRRRLAAISPDGSKIYVGGAGSDFEVYDRAFNRLKTIELDGEIYGSVFLVDR